MSISTQQIQAVVRTYNKQLRLSGINRTDKNPQHQCAKARVDLRPAENQHHLKQRHHKKRRAQ
jgi:hypothetical protein